MVHSRSATQRYDSHLLFFAVQLYFDVVYSGGFDLVNILMVVDRSA